MKNRNRITTALALATTATLAACGGGGPEWLDGLKAEYETTIGEISAQDLSLACIQIADLEDDEIALLLFSTQDPEGATSRYFAEHDITPTKDEMDSAMDAGVSILKDACK